MSQAFSVVHYLGKAFIQKYANHYFGGGHPTHCCIFSVNICSMRMYSHNARYCRTSKASCFIPLELLSSVSWIYSHES